MHTNSTHLPVLFYSLFTHVTFPPKGGKKKPTNQSNKKQKQISHLGSCGIKACQAVFPFVCTSFLANVHCNTSLVLFEASGFCYTTSTGSSPRTPLRHPVVALCYGHATALDLQDGPYHVLQEWTNSEPWFWHWVGAELVSPPALLCPCHLG